MFLYLIKTQLTFTSNFLDQNNPKYKYYCKNEFINIKDIEAVQTETRFRVLPGLKTISVASSVKTW